MAEDPSPQQPTSAAEAAAPTPVEATPAATVGTSVSPSPPPVALPAPDTGYTPDGVPTLEGVREKIESRFGTALGATELAEGIPEAKTAAQQYEARQKAAEEKLEEIRASMHKPD